MLAKTAAATRIFEIQLPAMARDFADLRVDKRQTVSEKLAML